MSAEFWEDEDSAVMTEEGEEKTPMDSIIDSTVAQIKRAEIEAKVGVAHKFPRKVSRFMKTAEDLACYNKEVAEKMYYSVPRGGKKITGPSIRLAEIAAMAWENLDILSRITAGREEGSRCIVAEGTVYDLERKTSYTSEVSTPTVYTSGDRSGHAYNEDMKNMVGNAACSKARRNAIFQAIPRAYIDIIMEKARNVALGKEKGLDARRVEIFAGFHKLAERAGIKLTDKQICAVVGKADVPDITWDDIGDLIGIGGAIREKETTLQEVLKPNVEGKENPLGNMPTRTTKAGKPPNGTAKTNGAAEKPAELQQTAESGKYKGSVAALFERAKACGWSEDDFDSIADNPIEDVEAQIALSERTKKEGMLV